VPADPYSLDKPPPPSSVPSACVLVCSLYYKPSVNVNKTSLIRWALHATAPTPSEARRWMSAIAAAQMIVKVRRYMFLYIKSTSLSLSIHIYIYT